MTRMSRQSRVLAALAVFVWSVEATEIASGQNSGHPARSGDEQI